MLGPADLAGPAARPARVHPGAGLGAGSGAALADDEAGDVDLLVESREGLLERDRHVVAEIVAAIGRTPRASADATAEERLEQVREGHVGEIDGRPAAHVRRRMAEHVVAAPAAGVGQHRVSLACLFEACGRGRVVRVAVRMRVHRDLAERPLELVCRGLPADAKHLVVIPPYGQRIRLPVGACGLVGGGADLWPVRTARDLDQRRPHDSIPDPVSPS